MNLFYIAAILLITFLSLFLYINTFKRKTSNKVVIFDMDETLGHFVEIGALWSLMKDANRNLTKNDFYNLMDSYPETLRPHILNILNYLKNMKKMGKVDRVIIFTNNQGPKSWSLLIKDYLNQKINYNLIDKVVGAYKVGNTQIEAHRTSHEKKYNDILNAARIPKNAKIAFLDDQRHYKMLHKNVFYILINGYTYFLSPEQVMQRLEKTYFNKKISNENMVYIYRNLKNMNKNFQIPETYSYPTYKENGKNILKNIQKFVNHF